MKGEHDVKDWEWADLAADDGREDVNKVQYDEGEIKHDGEYAFKGGLPGTSIFGLVLHQAQSGLMIILIIYLQLNLTYQTFLYNPNVYIILMDEDLKSLELSWPAQQKTIRADTISNRNIIRVLIKIVLCFFLICYTSKMLPEAEKIVSYVPQKWERVDVLNLHQVSPLNRNIKVYVAPANDSFQIDAVYEAEVFTLMDNVEKDRRMSIKVMDLDKFTDISENQLRFHLGDVHVLDEVAYRIKISKPIKLKRRFLQYPSDLITQNLTKTSEIAQSTNYTQHNTQINDTTTQTNETNSSITNTTTQTNVTQQQKQKKLQQQKKIQEEQKIKQQEEKKKKQEEQRIKQEQEQKKIKQEEEKKKKEKEELKRKQEEQAKKKAQQQKLRKEEEERKRIQEEEKQRVYEFTNIRIEAHMISSFGTVLELVIRYISILVIIYMAADNADAPKAIALICALTSNPLLFLQISYPNQVSNIIDSFCQSGPLLYPIVWMYYIHTKIKYAEHTEYKVFLIAKISAGIVLYFLNVLRILHFQVLIWETLVAIAVILLISIHMWDAFLNLHYQHHRDKVLAAVTLTYLGSLFTFKILAAPWQDIMIYIIVQLYGLHVIYLTGTKKKKKQKKQKNKKTLSEIEAIPIGSQEIKERLELQNKK